jgi:hypothetical protein
MFYDSYSRSKYLTGPFLLKTNMFSYVPIKHKQMSFVSNRGKFKLYAVLNGLIFPTPTQSRFHLNARYKQKSEINGVCKYVNKPVFVTHILQEHILDIILFCT